MSPRCKRRRPLTRAEKPLRDARLIVIATEDTHAPRRYFELFKNSRVKVRIVETQDGRSAPEHVLQRLDAVQEEPDFADDDEFWLMLDTDHWTEPNHIANFRNVCSEARQKGYEPANSNPCFVPRPATLRPMAAVNRHTRLQGRETDAVIMIAE